MTASLTDELLPLEMPRAAIEALIATGVQARFVLELVGEGALKVGQVDVRRARGTGDGPHRFEFGGAERRLILALSDGIDVTELVALSSRDEHSWALRAWSTDLLGEDLIGRAVAEEWRTLRLFSTPMAWLRGEGAGICVLDWNRQSLAALRSLGPACTLVVDPGAKEQMKTMLAYGGVPLVAEDRSGDRRAA